MTELFVSALVTLLVVIDPPGCAPIFSSLTPNATPQQRRSMAYRSVAIASVILLGFAIAGEAFLSALGISLDAFRIAGGLLLALIAADMVFETRTARREERASGAQGQDDVSVFPMAIPMIAGPGSIATVMLLVGRANGPAETAIVFGALAVVLLLTLLALLAAGPLLRFVGPKIEAMITRLLGVILAALATQIVIDGIKGAFDLG